MFKKSSAVALILCLLLGLCSCDVSKLFTAKKETIDPTQFRFEEQLSEPADGEEYALIHTTLGDIAVKLFPAYAPNAVKNFVTLAKEGHYNDTYFFCVTPGKACMGGSTAADGSTYKSVIGDGKPFAVESSDAIWHFSGSLSAISDRAEVADSRLLFIGNYPTDQTMLDKMERSKYPTALVEQYRKVGGLPELDRRHTVFGQTFRGLEVIDAINAVEVDAATGQPLTDIKIMSIEILTYTGE